MSADKYRPDLFSSYVCGMNGTAKHVDFVGIYIFHVKPTVKRFGCCVGACKVPY